MIRRESKLRFAARLVLCGMICAAIRISEAQEFSFIVTGDGSNAGTIFEDINGRYPERKFLVTTGDNDRSWEFQLHIDQKFGSAFPWFHTPGNHNVDRPTDVDWIVTNCLPRLSTQLAGATNFSDPIQPVGETAFASFERFFRYGAEDKVDEVLDALAAAGMGHTNAGYFVWADPDMTSEEFGLALEQVDLGNCLLENWRCDTEEEATKYLKMVYTVNKLSPYSFDYKNAHFIMLNLYYDRMYSIASICPRQMAWLEADLARNTKPLTFAFGHEAVKPVGNRHWPGTWALAPGQPDAFADLLRSHNVVAYFSGHTHIYGRSYLDGFYDLGVGSIYWKNNDSGRYTYVVVHVKNNRVTFETSGWDRGKGAELPFALVDNWTVNVNDPDARWRCVSPGPGGWVTALAIDPADGNRVLAGSDVFGAAVSEDGGLTWNSCFGFQMQEIEDFVFPDAPYGENPYYEFAATLGGVYASHDGGHNWIPKDAPGWPVSSAVEYNRPVSCVAKAERSAYLYAGLGSMRKGDSIDPSKCGFIHKYRFHADGQIWREVVDLKGLTSDHEANIQDIIVNPTGDYERDQLFVSLRNNGVWKSDDGGVTWTNTGLPVAHAYTMAAPLNDPDTLYVATGDSGIYKTVDGGNTWSRLPVEARCQTLEMCRSNPQVLYAGCYSGSNRGVIKTADGGATWQKVYDGYNAPLMPNPQASVSIKYHALAVDPNNPDHVIVGDDANLYVTFDGGATWQPSGCTTEDGGQSWTPTDFSGLCGEFIAYDPHNTNRFLMGSADGGLWQTWNGARTLTRCVTDDLDPYLEPGDEGEVFTDFQDGVICYQDPQTVYMVCDLQHVGGSQDNHGPLFKTTDAGQTWTMVCDGTFSSVRVSMTNDNIVIATENGIIRRSTDGGATFNDCTSDVGALRLSNDPQNPNVFYATSSTGVNRSSDGGLTWTNIGGPNVWGRLGSVAVDPTDTSRLFATSFGGFWRYDGVGWIQVKRVDYAGDIAVTSDGIVFGSTHNFPNHDVDPVTTGVWRSDDKGSSWYLYVEGLRTKRVAVIEASPIDGSVIVGTDGGFHRLDPAALTHEQTVDPKKPTEVQVIRIRQ